MSFARFLKYSVWDMLLAVVSSSALLYVMCTGFDCTRMWQGQPWVIVAACAILVLALMCASYRPITAVVGGVLLAAATVGLMAAFWLSSGAEGLLDDVEGNHATFVLVAVLCTVLVFVLSRRKATTIVLLAGGLFLCGLIEYLYFLGHVVPTLVFGLSTATMYAYRNYQRNVLDSDTSSMSFGAATAAGLVSVLLALSLGCGVYYAVVAPLDPPHVVVKLFTKHLRLDEKQVSGTGDNLSVQNPDLFSLNVSVEIQDAHSDDEETDPEQNMDDTSDADDETEQGGSTMGLSNEGDLGAQALNLEVPNWLALFIPFVLIALIASVIAVRRRLRTRAWAKLRELPSVKRVEAMYLFFMNKLGKMKVPEPGSLTLGEYLGSVRSTMQRFEQTDEIPAFEDLTRSYSGVVYGRVVPSADQLEQFESYYKGFYRNARKYRGSLKYLGLFFRI